MPQRISILISSLLLIAICVDCTPQQLKQMQRDHEKRMKQFEYEHAERQKAWAAIWKHDPNKNKSANARPTREINKGWSHQGAAPRQPGEERPERSAWDEFWGVEDTPSAAEAEVAAAKPKPIRRAGTGEYQDWTIECNAYEGPQRREMATRMAALLAEVPEIDKELVSVQHSDENSRVLYGNYPLEYVYSDKKREGAPVIELDDKIRGGVDFIRKLAVGDAHPFLQARPIEKPQEMQGLAAWDLHNATGTYSLHIGVTYGTPNLDNYKEAAMEWVKVLREMGHEAYYYFDPDDARVSICVGTFGPDAVKEIYDENKGTREQVYTAAVNALRAKDESFQYNLENGHIVYRRVMDEKTRRTERIPNLSFLVKIPKKGEKLGSDSDNRYRSGQTPEPARARRR